jgi:hypothetical protein
MTALGLALGTGTKTPDRQFGVSLAGGVPVVPETDELEQELHRNLKLRRELGGEVRLELLMANSAAARGDASYPREAPKAEGTFSDRLVRTAWIALGAVGLALGTLIAVWLT